MSNVEFKEDRTEDKFYVVVGPKGLNRIPSKLTYWAGGDGCRTPEWTDNFEGAKRFSNPLLALDCMQRLMSSNKDLSIQEIEMTTVVRRRNVKVKLVIEG